MNPVIPNKRFLTPDTLILIERCRQKDPLAQEQFYKLCYPDMIRICYRYAGDTDGAGTIFNNAMLRVFKNLDKYEEAGRLMAWVKRIVVNCCIDFCKANISITAVAVPASMPEAFIEPEVFNRLSGKDIQQLVRQLPPATATVFNLYVYEGFTHRQIAGELGISDNTSKWHFSEAKRLLKEMLGNFSTHSTKIYAAG